MKPIWYIGVLVILVLISGCTEQKTSLQTTATMTASGAIMVEIKNLAFNPANITIAKGTSVTWKQSDSASHTVTSVLGKYEPTHQVKVLDSPLLSKGQTYSYTFNEPGTFEYFCMIHPSMKGKVIVE